jgi:hypothetical protein
MRCEIDHLVVACADLDQGAAWVQARLGVAPREGGRHAAMGTHNRLLKLGARIYLELIAVDPDAPPPQRPRWFDLDRPDVRARAAETPFLATWVARTDDLVEAVTRVPALGEVHPLTRGAYAWRIAIPDDGSLPFGGALPAVLQWDGPAHPADALPEAGCALVQLALSHPVATSVIPLYRELRVAGPVDLKAGPRAFVARIRTPRGEVELS